MSPVSLFLRALPRNRSRNARLAGFEKRSETVRGLLLECVGDVLVAVRRECVGAVAHHLHDMGYLLALERDRAADGWEAWRASTLHREVEALSNAIEACTDLLGSPLALELSDALGC